MMEVTKTAMALNHQLYVDMPKKTFQGDDSPGFAVKLADKDMRLAVELAKAYGFNALVSRAAQESLNRAGKMGYVDRVIAALMKRGFQHHTSLSIAACGLQRVRQLWQPKCAGKKRCPRPQNWAWPRTTRCACCWPTTARLSG